MAAVCARCVQIPKSPFREWQSVHKGVGDGGGALLTLGSCMKVFVVHLPVVLVNLPRRVRGHNQCGYCLRAD